MPKINHICRLFVILLTVAIILPSVAKAQRRGESGVQVKLACPQLVKGLTKVAYLSSRTKEYQVVQLNANYLSDPVSIIPDSAGKIHFYDPENIPTKDQPSPPIASLGMAIAGQEQVVLLLPAPESSKFKYNAKSIISGKDFQYGKSCIVNLTRQPIYLRENKNRAAKPRSIAKGRSHVIGKRGVGMELNVELGTPHKKSKRVTRFYSATWTLDPLIRELCLVYQKPNKKWPSTKIISESKPVQIRQ